MWSKDPATIVKMAGAFLEGMQQNGIPVSLKHWPGIGAVTGDPHKTLPTLNKTADQMNKVDFVPFQQLMSHGPAMVMVTHVHVPSLDPDYPAVFSNKMVDGILRKQLGFQGVVITDSLHMDGVYDFFGAHEGKMSYFNALGEASVLSILAGDDILEGAYNTYTVKYINNYVHKAVDQGRITQARIDESVRRVLNMKWNYGIGTDKLLAFAGITLPQSAPASYIYSPSNAMLPVDVRRS
jgi:beta-N-acetylhexosaminidase